MIGYATLYTYKTMPSNNNITGIVGQITNVFVESQYRHQGIASSMIKQLMNDQSIGMYCLNSSKDAIEFYKKIGFQKRNNYMCR